MHKLARLHSGMNLSDIAQSHADAATAMVKMFFRHVSKVRGFDYRCGSSVASDQISQ